MIENFRLTIWTEKKERMPIHCGCDLKKKKKKVESILFSYWGFWKQRGILLIQKLKTLGSRRVGEGEIA